MKLKPVLTEKSLKDAKEGKYTFRVDLGLTKFQAKKIIEDTFGVNVKTTRSAKTGGEIRRTNRGKRAIGSTKKVIVSLGEKQKIDLFETEKKK